MRRCLKNCGPYFRNVTLTPHPRLREGEAQQVGRTDRIQTHVLHEEREDRPVAVVGAAFVHQLVRHLIVVDDDDLPAQDLEVEDVPCKPVLNDAATMLSTV